MNIFITGGSRGIGAAAVRRFTSEGHRVGFLYAKSADAAARLARETGAEAWQGDAADGEAVRAAAAAFGDTDVLLCNAGISHFGTIRDIREAEWDRLFDVNVKGVYHAVNAVLPGMLRRKSGVILMTSSMWGIAGASCEAAYSATKGAVIALCRSLAKELAPSGIRVNCVAPGVIQTDMLSGFQPEDLKTLAEETPLGRLGTPEEIAGVFSWLASDAASFLTGQVISADGGFIL